MTDKNLNDIINDILNCDYVILRKKQPKNKEWILSVNIQTGKIVFECPVMKKIK